MFGRDAAVGSNGLLQTPYATLHLSDTTVTPVNGVLGSGPNSPTVLLNLALSFKPSAASRTFLVDVSASDDIGHEDPFVVAGTITVHSPR